MGPVPSEQNFNFYPSKPSSMQKDPIPNWHTEFPPDPQPNKIPHNKLANS